MQSRIPFRPSVFSTLLIAALLAAAALLADTARADHFGEDEDDQNFALNTTSSEFSLLCSAVGGGHQRGGDFRGH